MQDLFNSSNAQYLSELFIQYQQNPFSLDEKWQRLFRDIDVNAISSGNNCLDKQIISNSLKALMLIRAYRVRGHFKAKLDPLELEKIKNHPDLDPKTYGFQSDNDNFYLDGVLGFEYASLKELLIKLENIYCSKIGFEYMHIQELEQRQWISERIENKHNFKDLNFSYLDIFENLAKAEMFEKFLNTKFPGAKRFGIEGAESTIVSLAYLISQSAKNDIDELCFGMAHRGRLCVLANILQKPIAEILALFQGFDLNPDDYTGSGDVKYHLGYSSDKIIDDKKIHLSLNANPSHLEAVNTVVLGKVRAKQDLKNDVKRNKTIGILIHGDAAFAGQGLVAETLALCGLDGYDTGGTLHIIINNQIGFTTSPPCSRSSPYCSDIAKGIQAPIFHVNGDSPEDVVFVTKLAIDFIKAFQTDVVLDIVCYRRFGHNEGDEPMFTQPVMYKKIAQHKSVKTLYKEYLINNNLLSEQDILQIEQNIQNHLDTEFKKSSSLAKKKMDLLEGEWSKIKHSNNKTGIEIKVLKELAIKINTIPKDFNINQKVKKALDIRLSSVLEEGQIDWGNAESLSFASLLYEDYKVRLSGQDCGRGTFSHRHASLYDQDNGNKYTPLNHVSKKDLFEVIDSPLAEASVLGFEYGYSSAYPNSLTLWEAQFGDFANGAQVIIDQFISSAEKKWNRLSALVMLLPHGYEGMGPEHSSARLERYLQLCAEDNMQIVNCTTTANYFHVLRRQMHSTTRKPLIVMSPKSLLRSRQASSLLKEFSDNNYFKTIIADEIKKTQKIERIIICSGKIYYDLLNFKEQNNIDNVLLIRVEQYYPFDEKTLLKALDSFKDAKVIWAQEEPKNMGAWNFIKEYIENALDTLQFKNKKLHYCGRNPSASPATGITKRHEAEQLNILKDAFLSMYS